MPKTIQKLKCQKIKKSCKECSNEKVQKKTMARIEKY